jgi:hypothetical protein
VRGVPKVRTSRAATPFPSRRTKHRAQVGEEANLEAALFGPSRSRTVKPPSRSGATTSWAYSRSVPTALTRDSRDERMLGHIASMSLWPRDQARRRSWVERKRSSRARRPSRGCGVCKSDRRKVGLALVTAGESAVERPDERQPRVVFRLYCDSGACWAVEGLSGRVNDGGGPEAPSSMAPTACFQRLIRAMAGGARFDEAELGARAAVCLHLRHENR